MVTAKGYAAQTAESPLAPWQFERRELGAHDVQIEILFCGVCHTDIHLTRNEWFEGIFPMVPGHEIVGRISALGAHAKKFSTGDLGGVGVMVDSCRECPDCKNGQEQFCSVAPVQPTIIWGMTASLFTGGIPIPSSFMKTSNITFPKSSTWPQ